MTAKKSIEICSQCERAQIKKNYELLCYNEQCEFFMEVQKIFLQKIEDIWFYGENDTKGFLNPK